MAEAKPFLDALAGAKSMGQVLDALELCQTTDDVTEFVAAYAERSDARTALSNLKFGLDYDGRDERIRALVSEWEVGIFGEGAHV